MDNYEKILCEFDERAAIIERYILENESKEALIDMLLDVKKEKMQLEIKNKELLQILKYTYNF